MIIATAVYLFVCAALGLLVCGIHLAGEKHGLATLAFLIMLVDTFLAFGLLEHV